MEKNPKENNAKQHDDDRRSAPCATAPSPTNATSRRHPRIAETLSLKTKDSSQQQNKSSVTQSPVARAIVAWRSSKSGGQNTTRETIVTATDAMVAVEDDLTNTTVVQPGALAVPGMGTAHEPSPGYPEDDDPENSSISNSRERENQSRDNNDDDHLVVAQPFDLEAHNQALTQQMTQKIPRAALVQHNIKKRVALVGLALLFLVPLLVLVVVIVARNRRDDSSSLAGDTSATIPPAAVEIPVNIACPKAIILDVEQERTVFHEILVNEYPSIWDEGNVTIRTPCAGAPLQEDTIGLWFRVPAWVPIDTFLENSTFNSRNERRQYRASTCQASTFDTQLSIFAASSGEDCQELACVMANDDGVCGLQSSVSWQVLPNTDYYILAHYNQKNAKETTANETIVMPDVLSFGLNLIPIDHDLCEFSIGPVVPPKNGKITMKGSFANSTRDFFGLDTSCVNVGYVTERDRDRGRGVWYTVQGTGGGIVASTCQEEPISSGDEGFDPLRFEVSLVVFTGSCDNLQTVACAPAARECGAYSRVSWPSTQGQLYYVLAINSRGYNRENEEGLLVTNNNNVDFKLEFWEFDFAENNECSSAQALPLDGSEIVGSTLNATIEVFDSCNNNEVNSRGVWYSISSTREEVLQLSVTSATDTVASLHVYRTLFSTSCPADKDPVNFQCFQSARGKSGETTEVLIRVDPAHSYWLLVHSTEYGHDDGSLQSFVLSATPTNAVANDVCESAIGPLPTDGRITAGTNINATFHLQLCSFSFTNGVWYTVLGDGGFLRASTCHLGSALPNSIIFIFKGSCNDNLEDECLTDSFFRNMGFSSIDTCATVKWLSKLDQEYLLYVYGWNDVYDNFRLSLESFDVVVNDVCENATEVIQYGQILGSTVDAMPDPEIIDDHEPISTFDGSPLLGYSRFCGNLIRTGNGVWYKFVGTGSRMTSRACALDQTTIHSQTPELSIFTGQCGNLTCVPLNTSSWDCPALNGGAVSFDSIAGEVYYAYVWHEYSIQDTPFEFFVGPPVSNDECSDTSEVLGLTNGTLSVAGTTYDALHDAEPHGYEVCQPAFWTGRLGVWYRVVGTGEWLSASLCDTIVEDSNVDLALAIFSGTCNNLTCVARGTDDCGNREKAVWKSEMGVVYHILVVASEYVDFDLRVDEFLET